MEETQMIIGPPPASTTEDSSDPIVPPDKVLKRINLVDIHPKKSQIKNIKHFFYHI